MRPRSSGTGRVRLCVVAPRAAYEPVAGEIILVDTPGSTSDNPANFDYMRRRKPLYPLEKSASYAVSLPVTC